MFVAKKEKRLSKWMLFVAFLLCGLVLIFSPVCSFEVRAQEETEYTQTDLEQDERLNSLEKRLEEMSLEEKMMAFFDNGDMEAKYKILLSMREEITDTIIDNLAVDVDVVIPDGEINKRFDDLRKAIQTRQKYEQNSRLR